ncbi:hypothetical protein ASD89_19745 [Caulobacter sp. Root656]|nr:hypothetical protein ASD89_19745 [Caulobacter sp. Root656]
MNPGQFHEIRPRTWIDTAGEVADCLLRKAGVADLIVVNCKRDHWMATGSRAAAATLAQKTRCPVVAVPDQAPGLDPTGPVVVAWDGSAPVMATLRAAVPLLTLSRQVRLVTVGAIRASRHKRRRSIWNAMASAPR